MRPDLLYIIILEVGMKKSKSIDVICDLLIFSIMLCLLVVPFLTSKDASAQARAANEDSSQGIYNVLFLGRDDAAQLSDVIILASLNVANGDVCVMQIPRDTYFDYGSQSVKINGAPRTLGAEKFASELGNALGINIDYYLSLSLDDVKEIVDAISGVEIDVPTDMTYEDPYQKLSIELKAGRQVLNGAQALGFLRYRSGYAMGDLGRLDAQKLFLNAFCKRVGEIKNPVAIYNLINLFCTRARTNINEQSILSLGLKLSKAKNGEVTYLTSPGEAVQCESSGAWYYILSRESMAEALAEHFGADFSKKDFDISNNFVDKRNKSFYDIYNKRCDYIIYSADDVENNQININ